MFTKLFDFSFERTRQQAIGFYIVWLIGGSLITAIIVQTYMRLTGHAMPPATDFAGAMRAVQETGQGVVPTVIFVFSASMALLVVRAKNAFNRTAATCVLLAGILSIFGAIFSLIPVAYLTTLPNKSSS